MKENQQPNLTNEEKDVKSDSQEGRDPACWDLQSQTVIRSSKPRSVTQNVTNEQEQFNALSTSVSRENIFYRRVQTFSCQALQHL